VSAELRALVIGQAKHPEFSGALAALAAHAGMFSAADIGAARGLLREGLHPDLILLAQQHAGEFEPGAVDGLRCLAPLAPVIALQSSWCEGEGRSGRPLPGVVRISWRRFAAEIVPGLVRLKNGELPDWASPATSTPEERLLRRVKEPVPRGRGTVGILAETHEARRMLSDVAAAGGWNVTVLPSAWVTGTSDADRAGHAPSATSHVVVWDLTEPGEEITPAIRRLRQRVGDIGIILLAGFPRAEDFRRAQEVGASAVVSKPFSCQELLAEVARAVSGQHPLTPRQLVT